MEKREMIFKAWIDVERRVGDRIVHEGKMVDVVSLKANGIITYPYKTIQHGTTRETYPEALLQWIGLEDEDGVKIYEGDIIESTEYGWRGEVRKSRAAFVALRDNMYNADKYCGYIEWPDEYFNNVKVIGNIYENPELLK